MVGVWLRVVDGGVVGSRKESNECRVCSLGRESLNVDVGGE